MGKIFEPHQPTYETLGIVQEWLTRDLLVTVDIKIGNKAYPKLYAVAERDITSEEIMVGVASYLKHHNAPGANKLAHGILIVRILFKNQNFNTQYRHWTIITMK